MMIQDLIRHISGGEMAVDALHSDCEAPQPGDAFVAFYIGLGFKSERAEFEVIEAQPHPSGWEGTVREIGRETNE